jgi:hypothetical protein
MKVSVEGLSASVPGALRVCRLDRDLPAIEAWMPSRRGVVSIAAETPDLVAAFNESVGQGLTDNTRSDDADSSAHADLPITRWSR